MDPIDNAFFDDIILENYSESENSEEFENNGDEKENKKKITSAQSKKLISTMNSWTNQISKGKMKSDQQTIQLLREWDELAQKLNGLGPPHHTSSEWRRIWTKMKYNKKRKSLTGLDNRSENKKVKRQNTTISNKCHLKSSVISTVEMAESEMQCHQKTNVGENVIHTVEPVKSKKQTSSDGDSVISTVEPVESESDKQITGNFVQREFSRIMHAIDSLGDKHAAAYETMNKKLDDLAMKQECMNENLNVLAMAVGISINAQKCPE